MFFERVFCSEQFVFNRKEMIMMKSPVTEIKKDAKASLKEARELFETAATLTGAKAEEMRDKAMRLLESALTTAQTLKANSFAAGKEAMTSADNFVKENPWRTIAAVAAAGILLGVILGRK